MQVDDHVVRGQVGAMHVIIFDILALSFHFTRMAADRPRVLGGLFVKSVVLYRSNWSILSSGTRIEDANMHEIENLVIWDDFGSTSFAKLKRQKAYQMVPSSTLFIW